MARVAPVFLWMAAAAGIGSLALAAAPLLRGPPATAPQPAGAPGPALAGPPARIDLGPILAFGAFGSPQAPPDTQAAAPQSMAGLVLLGVTLAEPAGASRAIIAGGTEISRSYAIGAQVTGGTILAGIGADHVVMDVDGSKVRLGFAASGAGAENGDDAGADVAGMGTGIGAGPDLRNLIPAANRAAPAVQPQVADDPAALADAAVARYRDALNQDAPGLLDQLGLLPGPDGYTVADTADALVLGAGFLPGDLVASVNGQKVGDIDADQRYFDQVAASGRARVEVVREGRSVVMTFPLQ